MQSVEFYIPEVNTDALAADVSNSLIGVSGVAQVDVDTTSHIISMQYDPVFVRPERLQSFLTGSGYPIDRTKTEDTEAETAGP